MAGKGIHPTSNDVSSTASLLHTLNMKKPSLHLGSKYRYLVAGSLTGMIARTITSPLDVIKISLQTQAHTAPFSTRAHYTGVGHAFSLIFRQEGLRGFFKGNGTEVVRQIPYAGIKFFIFKYSVELRHKKLSHVEHFMHGAAAASVAIASTYPLETVRLRLTLQSLQQGSVRVYHGLFHTMRHIILEEGPAVLYRGLYPTLLGGALYEALQFTLYEGLKRKMQYIQRPASPSSSSQLGSATQLWVGGLSGALSKTVTHPIDVVRRRLQAQSHVYGMNRTQYRNALDCFRKIAKQEGLSGLYAGLSPSLLRIVPFSATVFFAFERILHLLEAL
eukprot:GCRY01001811.1.p1 GENE.GCRY01001811.1~~GCRY01001811.1.p1  ORF type:complete len:332 (+),score=65.31 GCRY01001811.1:303-1298(+)